MLALSPSASLCRCLLPPLRVMLPRLCQAGLQSLEFSPFETSPTPSFPHSCSPSCNPGSPAAPWAGARALPVPDLHFTRLEPETSPLPQPWDADLAWSPRAAKSHSLCSLTTVNFWLARCITSHLGLRIFIVLLVLCQHFPSLLLSKHLCKHHSAGFPSARLCQGRVSETP